MDANDRLALMIRACVEEDVRDLAFPDDLIDRVTARSSRWVLPSLRLPALAGMLATASLLVAIPVGFNLNLTGAPPAVHGQNAAPQPKNLGGEGIEVTEVPKGFRATTSKGPQEVTRSRASTRIWQVAFRRALGKGGRGATIIVRVYSGDTSIPKALLDFTADGSLLRTRELRFPQGQAVILTNMAHKTIVWQREPGLVVLVASENVSRPELIKIAEGVTIK